MLGAADSWTALARFAAVCVLRWAGALAAPLLMLVIHHPCVDRMLESMPASFVLPVRARELKELKETVLRVI